MGIEVVEYVVRRSGRPACITLYGYQTELHREIYEDNPSYIPSTVGEAGRELGDINVIIRIWRDDYPDDDTIWIDVVFLNSYHRSSLP